MRSGCQMKCGDKCFLWRYLQFDLQLIKCYFRYTCEHYSIIIYLFFISVQYTIHDTFDSFGLPHSGRPMDFIDSYICIPYADLFSCSYSLLLVHSLIHVNSCDCNSIFEFFLVCRISSTFFLTQSDFQRNSPIKK